MLGYITLLYSLPNFADSIGLSNQQAAAISAYLNLGTACGRPIIGFVSDRLGRIEIAGYLTLFCGLTCFAIWIPAKTYGVTIFFAIVSGAVVGVFWMVSYPSFLRCCADSAKDCCTDSCRSGRIKAGAVCLVGNVGYDLSAHFM